MKKRKRKQSPFINPRNIIFNRGLMHSDDIKVRIQLARVSMDTIVLDYLLKDKNYRVRLELAKRKYKFKYLFEDRSKVVRECVFDSLTENDVKNLPLKLKIILANNGRFFDVLSNDKNPNIRMRVVRSGYNLFNFINDTDPRIRKMLIEREYALDYFIRDKSDDVREFLVNKYLELELEDRLEPFVNDKDPSIRIELAKHGYFLEVLCRDSDENVRQAVLKQGCYYNGDDYTEIDSPNIGIIEVMDKLKDNDTEEAIFNLSLDDRIVLAENGYYPEVLYKDMNMDVRRLVAISGYKPDVMINDVSWKVRQGVQIYHSNVMKRRNRNEY